VLHKIGIPKETRPFKPHITVGRNKRPFNFKSLYALIAEKEHLPITSIQVKAFQVFKSELTPEGPIYKILKEIPVSHGQA
jgi:2'-5' RNA ligase